MFQALTEQGTASGLSGERPDAGLPAAVERIVLGSDQITIMIKADAEGDQTTIQVPWTPAPSRRQRSIIPCEGEGQDTALRPMRVEAHAKLLQALQP